MNTALLRRLMLCVVLLLAGTGMVVASEEFPNRKLYPTLSYIELNDFQAIYSKAVVVDVRSRLEYDTLHLDRAINYSRAEADFVDNMLKLRDQNKGKTIVLYCNGRKCEQSYKAGKKCKDHRIDVLVYDGGVFEYATANPHSAILVGKQMGSAAKLISKDNFRKHLITAERFVEMVSSKNTMVVDVRDKFQRDGISLFVGMEKRADLSEREELHRLIEQAKRENKTMLFYDNAGKQVEWLQYFLEDSQIASYYFMDGGARSYFAGLSKQFTAAK